VGEALAHAARAELEQRLAQRALAVGVGGLAAGGEHDRVRRARRVALGADHVHVRHAEARRRRAWPRPRCRRRRAGEQRARHRVVHPVEVERHALVEAPVRERVAVALHELEHAVGERALERVAGAHAVGDRREQPVAGPVSPTFDAAYSSGTSCVAPSGQRTASTHLQRAVGTVGRCPTGRRQRSGSSAGTPRATSWAYDASRRGSRRKLAHAPNVSAISPSALVRAARSVSPYPTPERNAPSGLVHTA
jgi:hypothetical protein